MSDLNISNASIGYDESGMNDAIKEIQINLIDNVVETLQKNIPTLTRNVDSYWKGQAASKFQNKIESDNTTIINALKKIKEDFENEFKQMMNNSANSDSAIAESINSLSTGTFGNYNKSNGATNNTTSNNNVVPNAQPMVSESTQKSQPQLSKEEVNKEADNINIDDTPKDRKFGSQYTADHERQKGEEALRLKEQEEQMKEQPKEESKPIDNPSPVQDTIDISPKDKTTTEEASDSQKQKEPNAQPTKENEDSSFGDKTIADHERQKGEEANERMADEREAREKVDDEVAERLPEKVDDGVAVKEPDETKQADDVIEDKTTADHERKNGLEANARMAAEREAREKDESDGTDKDSQKDIQDKLLKEQAQRSADKINEVTNKNNEEEKYLPEVLSIVDDSNDGKYLDGVLEKNDGEYLDGLLSRVDDDKDSNITTEQPKTETAPSSNQNTVVTQQTPVESTYNEDVYENITQPTIIPSSDTGDQSIADHERQKGEAAAQQAADERAQQREQQETNFVNTARTYLGTPYVYGGTSSSGIDCSGLVQSVCRANGVEVPRTTDTLANAGVQVSSDDIRPGDVLFTNGGKHVVIVTNVADDGSLTVLSANSVAGRVTEGPLYDSYVQARRYF